MKVKSLLRFFFLVHLLIILNGLQIQKKKIWESVQPHLKTDASCAATLGVNYMRTSAGVIVSESLKNANISWVSRDVTLSLPNTCPSELNYFLLSLDSVNLLVYGINYDLLIGITLLKVGARLLSQFDNIDDTFALKLTFFFIVVVKINWKILFIDNIIIKN